MNDVKQLARAIEASWSADTSYDASEWTSDNRARGQCVATSLVVQDYLQGDLQKLSTVFNGRPETHYRNILSNGLIIDLTRGQYPDDQELTPSLVDLESFDSIREKRLSESDTRNRYLRLRQRVQQILEN